MARVHEQPGWQALIQDLSAAVFLRNGLVIGDWWTGDWWIGGLVIGGLVDKIIQVKSPTKEEVSPGQTHEFSIDLREV